MIKATLEDIAVASDGSYFLMLLSTGDGDIVPISIDPLQAQAIVIGQTHEKFERPLTHDLLLSVIEMLDASLKRIEITDLQDGVYFSRLVLEAKGIEYDIDARPSDAMALAVRSEVDMFIAEAVVEQAAMTDDFGGSGGVEA
ncbi:bifunctional nuclease family protein [soil metagenome]